MGKTKWSSSEPEMKHQQPGYRLQVTRPQRRQYPGRHFLSDLETLPLSVLLRQVWLRLRRQWLSVRFRTGHLATTKTALKLAVVSLLAYVLFFQEAAMFAPDDQRVVSESIGPYVGKSLFGKSGKSGGKNQAAPVGARQLTREMAEDYIGRYHRIAVEEMRRYGVPASISLAQGLVESRAGASKLAMRNNNHFGIKCFSRRCRKGHCSNFTDDTHKDFFRAFASPWESWRAHSVMISTGRYARLKKHGRDYRKWAYGLKSLGYATDATYAEKLVEMIEAYELEQYDRW